jgi:hypothetical protein
MTAYGKVGVGVSRRVRTKDPVSHLQIDKIYMLGKKRQVQKNMFNRFSTNDRHAFILQCMKDMGSKDLLYS